VRPRLLDLFCGAGGAAMGYHRAGFDVVGVDIEPQPNYPFTFYQGDALGYLDAYAVGTFDAIHASPPCQAYSLATHYHGTQSDHPDLVAPTRTLLEQTGLPWVMENVEGAPMRRDLVLCGEMFGLRLHRHRVFETGGGFYAMQPPHQKHKLKGAAHNCDLREGHARLVAGNYADHDSACEAMGVTWMHRSELRLAIPPAYTEFIGEQLLNHVS
jgi:DNA (cytosine-5)-methyltransferase 1